MVKKIIRYIGITIALLIATNLISKFSTLIADLFYPIFQGIDPDDEFIQSTIHHIVQAIVALVIMYIILKSNKASIKDYGFNTKNLKFSITAALIFIIMCAVIQFGMGYLMSVNSSALLEPSFPLTRRNIIGKGLFFFFICGTSEEILFRMFVLICFVFLVEMDAFNDKKAKVLYIIIASVVFALNHITYTIYPFAVTQFNIQQIVTCMVFSTFLAWLYIRTKSIIGPMIAHTMLNIIVLVSQVVFCSG